ncbi:MAG: TolC family protein [Calditrichia bacterium]
MKLKILVLLLLFNLLWSTRPILAGEIYRLKWENVVEQVREQNLNLQYERLNYRSQKLNQWKALSDFLPVISYGFQGTNNLELPEFVFMGQRIRVGTDYNFSHALQLQLPLFTGGMRLANYRMQRKMTQSLKEMLRFKEGETVVNALKAYWQILVAEQNLRTARRNLQAARANRQQVEQFYQQGMATRLDLYRAQAHSSSLEPVLIAARKNRHLAYQNLKFLLNLPAEDSLVVLDTLTIRHYLGELEERSLPELMEFAFRNRGDLAGLSAQKAAASARKWMSASAFLPRVVLSASVQHQAQIDQRTVSWDDYTRVKAAGISLQFPLFEGGKRAINFQQARIVEKQVHLQLQQLKRQIELEVENAYSSFLEARANLESYRLAREQAREAFRLAGLNYREGILNQVEVLGAESSLFQAELAFVQGVYQYHLSQLELLKALGKIDMLWGEE